MNAPPTADMADILRFLRLLEWGEEVCAELRCLGNRETGFRHGTISGYFRDLELMAKAAAYWSGKVEGCYAVLNPIPRRIWHRTRNRLRLYTPRDYTTKDHEVRERRWLLVDLDAIRPA